MPSGNAVWSTRGVVLQTDVYMNARIQGFKLKTVAFAKQRGRVSETEMEAAFCPGKIKSCRNHRFAEKLWDPERLRGASQERSQWSHRQ